MKKLLAGLFIFGALTIGVTQVHASVISDALLKIDNLSKEITKLKAGLTAAGYSSSTWGGDSSTNTGYSSSTWGGGTSTGSNSTTNIPTPVTDLAHRISVWQGKVNQHIDSNGNWQTDSDGVSGAEMDKLTYCKKFYPNTTSVSEYKTETINTWHDAGNLNTYSSTRMSYLCVEDIIFTTPTLKTTADISISTSSAFVTASIVGNSLNKGVSYWKLFISCESGVLVSSDKPNLCGTEIRMDTYNMANPSGDYLLLTAGVKNNSSVPSKLTLSLSPYNSKNIKIREDKKEIIIPSSNTTTPSITVLSPNGEDNIKLGDKYNIRWESRGPLSGNNVSLSLKEEGSTCNTTLPGCQSEFGIAYNITNYGSYIWDTSLKMSGPSTGPNSISVTPGVKYRIGVCGLVIGVCDYSDNAFTIKQSITEDGCLNGGIYSSTTGAKCSNSDKKITITTDLTPRISVWSGKINQHVDVNSQMWQSDFDGVSGAEINKLTYCQKWYPNTANVFEYKNETINSWQEVGNINYYPSTRMSYRCAESTIDTGCTNGNIYSYTTGQLCVYSSPSSTSIQRTLRFGMNGDDVKLLQQFLGIFADGVYGKGTVNSVIKWQISHGISGDGMVGPETQAKMGL